MQLCRNQCQYDNLRCHFDDRATTDRPMAPVYTYNKYICQAAPDTSRSPMDF